MTPRVLETCSMSAGRSYLLDAVTEAYWLGVEFAVESGVVKVRGDREIIGLLRTVRDELVGLLTGPCAGCGAEPACWEAGTAVPWCRPCALERGRRLLALERPDLSLPEAPPVPRLVVSHPTPAGPRCTFCGRPGAPSLCCDRHLLPMCEEHRYQSGFYAHRVPPWLRGDDGGIDERTEP